MGAAGRGGVASLSPAWDEFEHSVDAGDGTERFDAVRERLLTWGIHEEAGLRVENAPARVAVGATAGLHTRVFGIPVVAPVEVTRLVDEPGRTGFEYRALPGHPEEGVESFEAALDAGGRVVFTVRARSRPATWWSRLCAPVARAVQRRITRTYLRAAAR